MAATTPSRQVQFLKQYTASAEKQLMAAAREFEKQLVDTVTKATGAASNLTTKRGQQAVYNKVLKDWQGFNVTYEEWAAGATEALSKQFKGYALEAIIEQTGRVATRPAQKWSADYAKKIFELIHPDNEKNLAAVFTDKMSSLQIQSLRSAVVDANRQAALEGWTSQRLRKEIQTKWWDLAKEASDEMFTDVSGRKWSNRRYLQMLTRTTTARVSRESYNQTLIQNGDDLQRIRNVGDTCETCKAWDMVIVSISGTDPKYPSYRQAVDAGVFHPNCDCLTQRVDETVNAQQIEDQAKQKNVNWNDLDAVKEYGSEARNG